MCGIAEHETYLTIHFTNQIYPGAPAATWERPMAL
jgi:hypothetical protein